MRDSFIKKNKGKILDIIMIEEIMSNIATILEEDTPEETVYTQILMVTDHILEELPTV